MINKILILFLILIGETFSQQNQALYSDSLQEKLLNSYPQDAYVFFNDSLIGNTPIFVTKYFDKLLLKKDSYEDLQISFDEISNNKIFSLNFIGKQQETSFFEKDLFKVLTAGIVLLGGTTAYFKIKADNKFEQYQDTGENWYLQETRKFDLISGITFTALQINFGLLIYYFLIE